MSKPNRKLISDLFAAYERGDREAMDSLLARDVVYHIPGRNQFSGEHRGPHAVIDLWHRQKEHLGGLPYRAEPYDVSVTDDHVVMLAHVSAQRGQTSYRFQTANVYRIADGKVAECWPHVFDLHAFDEFWSPGDPRDVARRFVDALSAHDLSAAVECFAEDYHDTAPARPGEEVHGRDRVRQNFAALFEGVPNVQAEIVESVADGNVIWMEWRMWGTRAEGTTMEFVGVNLFCVEGDRFTWGRIYSDLVSPRGDIDAQIERMTSASPGRKPELDLREVHVDALGRADAPGPTDAARSLAGTGEMSASGHSTKVDGLTIANERAGSGPSVVLLHGFFGDSRVWRPQVDGLCDAFDVVAWDAPGCGRSSDPPATFRMADYADCLAAFIEALALVHPRVVGLSFGATPGLELYRRHPEMPSALVLAAAYAGWAGSLPPKMVQQRLRETIADLDLAPRRVVAKYLPGLLTDSAPPAVRDEVAAIMSDFHPAGMKAMTRSLAEADLRDVLPQINLPTLLIYGDRDVRSPVGVARDLHAHIPDAQLVLIEGIGHLSNAEAADRFTAEIRRFLAAET